MGTRIGAVVALSDGDAMILIVTVNSIEIEKIGKANFEFVNSNFSAEVLKRNMLDALLIKDE